MAKKSSFVPTVKMLVQPHRSFNKHDCKPYSEGDRHGMAVNMVMRLGLIIDVLKLTPGPNCQSLANAFNKRFHGAAYKASDMATALKKLEKVGIVQCTGRGWSLTPLGLKIWAKAKIIKLN